jgi:hypothetical protein
MAPPKEATASTSVPKKPGGQPAMLSVVEEMTEASSSVETFPRDYILLRNPSTKQVHLHKDVKYSLVEPLIP